MGVVYVPEAVPEKLEPMGNTAILLHYVCMDVWESTSS